MDDNELPEGWTEVCLDAVVDILDNRRDPINAENREKRLEGSDQKYPYYGATGQVGWIDDYLFDEDLVLLGEDGAPFLESFRNVAYTISGKAWVNNHAHVLRAREGVITTSYLKHYLNEVDYRDFVSGSTRLKLTQGRMKEIPILLPPLPEQRRIADRLDAIQSRTQATGETLDQVPDRIEEYRQSVLNAAFTGRLTADWREDHSDVEPGELLLERILDERYRGWKKDYRAKYEAKGKKPPSGWKSRYSEPVEPEKYPDHPIPDSWEWSGMNAVFQWSNGDSLTKDEQEDGPYHVYGGNGVKGSHTDYMVEEETVVIGRVGANCGNVHLAEPESWITDNAIYADWQSSLIDEEFIVRQLRHLRLNRIAGGSGQPYISQKKLNSLAITLPPYDEQAEISRRIRQRLDKIDEMARHIEQAGERLHHLDRSVLAKAFRGELVETEAERAHREDRDYETAEELLKRVDEKTARDTDTTVPKSDGEKTARVDENGQIEMKVVDDENASL